MVRLPLLLSALMVPPGLSWSIPRRTTKILERDEDVTNNGVANFSRRIAPSVAVVNGYLYIDGGTIAMTNNASSTDQDFQPNTLSIPLTNSWTNMTAAFSSTQKVNAPANNYQAMWPDGLGSFHVWAGEAASGGSAAWNKSADRIWFFKEDGFGSGSWAAGVVDGPDIIRSSESGFAQCGDTLYFLGGYSNSWTDPAVSQGPSEKIPTPGLVSYSMDNKTWNNYSASGFSGVGTFFRGGGACLSEYGQNGLLFFIGGETDGLALYHDPGTFIPMNTIKFYDPTKQEWYTQAATGTVPSVRSRFCMVDAKGQNDTHEIFLYGGMDASVSTAYDELYVLTIPGFNWFRANYAPTSPRADLACAVGGNRQMILVGGGNMALGSWSDIYADKDPWAQGIGVFDMTAMVWKDEFDTGAPEYDSPQQVQAWYSGGGLNTVKWNSPDVQAVFQSTNNNTNPKPNPSSTGPSVGQIAGGVIGAVAGVAILGVVAFYYLRKRRRNKSNIYGEQENQQVTDDKDQGVKTPLDSVARTELLGQEVPGELQGEYPILPLHPQELPADVPQHAMW